MVMPHRKEQVFGATSPLQHLIAEQGVSHHRRLLYWLKRPPGGEDLLGEKDHAHVVKKTCLLYLPDLPPLEPQFLGDEDSIVSHPLRAALGVRVLGLQSIDEGLHAPEIARHQALFLAASGKVGSGPDHHQHCQEVGPEECASSPPAEIQHHCHHQGIAGEEEPADGDEQALPAEQKVAYRLQHYGG